MTHWNNAVGVGDEDGQGPPLWVPVGLLVIGIGVVCGALLAIRDYGELLEGSWYLPVMVAFLVVMAVGTGCATRGLTGIANAVRERRR